MEMKRKQFRVEKGNGLESYSKPELSISSTPDLTLFHVRCYGLKTQDIESYEYGIPERLKTSYSARTSFDHPIFIP